MPPVRRLTACRLGPMGQDAGLDAGFFGGFLPLRLLAETYLRERKEISMDDPLLKAIGTRMMDARKKAGYTQEQLGEVTGLSIKMISV